MDEKGVLKWRFDVSTFRLIGRDLITDRVTALFELIKNCYDANATEVTILFSNVSKISPNSYISISDNGIGMSFEDIRDKWMVIGTSSKRRSPLSPKPFERKCVGEKGIGRFAVDKLGDKLCITTKKEGEDNWLSVNIDWKEYYHQSGEINGATKLFTDIENEYTLSHADDQSASGTTLLVNEARDAWEKKDIIRLLREASRIVSPFDDSRDVFRIHVIAPEYELDAWSEEFKIDPTDLATISASIEVIEGKQQCLLFNESSGKIDIKYGDIPLCGGLSMKLYYFDGKARSAFRKKFPEAEIDGVKIYRDGVITTPFAESEENPDKKRDILGIDKRLWRDLFDKVSTRELIGVINISKAGNPQIIDATNRQDFTDTPEYRALKDFLFDQLYAFDQYKVFVRDHKKSEQTKKIQSAGHGVVQIVESIDKLIQSTPQLTNELSALKAVALKAEKGIESAVKDQQNAEEERVRHENMYMRIMSRQEDSINVTHAVKTSMGKIQRQAEFFKDRFPNPALDEYFILYAKQIYHEMLQLDRATDELFDYSKTNLPFVDIDIKQLVEYLLKSYAERFNEQHIDLEMSIEDNLVLNCNEMFFYDIVQNITDNAIKAMAESDVKRYRCTVKAHEDKLVMDFSDTGCGIPVEKREWVFGIYNTTTAEQGGGGIGLYAVRLRVNALKGHVYVTDSEFAPLGTTIHIELPFKK